MNYLTTNNNTYATYMHNALAIKQSLEKISSNKVYVDMDGTLLSGELDAQFIASNYDIAWYDTQHVTTLPVNYELVNILKALKALNVELILWTNRSLIQREMTRLNLGDLWYLFKEHQFHAGNKRDTNLDGYTFDNEEKYVHFGQLINW